MSVPSDDADKTLPAAEDPIVEVELDVGDAIRIGNRVLQILDIEGDSSMLRIDQLHQPDDASHGHRWMERPR